MLHPIWRSTLCEYDTMRYEIMNQPDGSNDSAAVEYQPQFFGCKAKDFGII